jgi:small subunit ribosomal protein S8
MTNYPLGDFLIRIKNAVMVGKKEVVFANTKAILACAMALKKAGFLDSAEVKSGILTIQLAFRRKRPVISDIKLVSKPGLRVYMNVSEVAKRRKPSILLLSTPKGILSSREVVKGNVGGEVIAEIL